jgi:hypothetical protein
MIVFELSRFLRKSTVLVRFVARMCQFGLIAIPIYMGRVYTWDVPDLGLDGHAAHRTPYAGTQSWRPEKTVNLCSGHFLGARADS